MNKRWNLVKWRTENDYSQRALAEAIGIRQRTLHDIENAYRKPQRRTMQKLADFTGLNERQILE